MHHRGASAEFFQQVFFNASSNTKNKTNKQETQKKPKQQKPQKPKQTKKIMCFNSLTGKIRLRQILGTLPAQGKIMRLMAASRELEQEKTGEGLY